MTRTAPRLIALALLGASLGGPAAAEELAPDQPPLPSTEKLEEALVGSLCFVGVSAADDRLLFDVTLRLVNLGTVTWLPGEHHFTLPTDARAFVAAAESAPVRFVEIPHGARLVGAVPPGESEASFRFQIDNPASSLLPWNQRSELSLAIGLPPRVLRANVWAELGPEMGLDVPGFSPPTRQSSPTGATGLVTAWVASSATDTLRAIPLRLTGLPRRGLAPLLAVLTALALLCWGLLAVLRHRSSPEGPAPDDVALARRLLLDELLAVERAARDGHIGPQTREQARRTLLSSLARLEPDPAEPTP